jgi:hypothetical protein
VRGNQHETIEAFNTAWEAQAKAFDELANAGLAVKTAAAHADMKDYTGLFLDAYFALVSAAYRKCDPNHLLIGARYQPITINDEQLCRITGQYCDVMSFNYYTYGIEKDLLQNIYKLRNLRRAPRHARAVRVERPALPARRRSAITTPDGPQKNPGLHEVRDAPRR